MHHRRSSCGAPEHNHGLLHLAKKEEHHPMSSPAVPKFDASTLQPQAALGAGSQGPASDRKYINEGDGFTLMFSLPFQRADIYRELISPKQLGVDHSNVQIKITRRTDSEQAKLEQQLQESARGKESKEIIEHVQSSLLSSLSVGCERTVTFPDGVVVSELVELVEPSVIRWRQVESKRSTNMVGKPGGDLPEVTIALDELPDDAGTSIRMTYDFYQIIKEDGTALDGGMMSKLLSQATQGWAGDMASRGYQTCTGGEALTARGGSGFGRNPAELGSVVLRSARSMKKDMDEEAAMKEAMMARAAASMGK
jgi:hypothetical protein